MSLTAASTALPTDDLLQFFNACPTPWHASSELMARLQAAGFVVLDEQETWTLTAGQTYCVARYGAPVAAFRYPGADALQRHGLRILAAHLDSPGLRVKPNGIQTDVGGVGRLGVEVYGGPILATFADRDLSLAGRLVVRDHSVAGAKIITRLLRFDEPLMRIPNAAIHINRTVNDKGLLLHKHTQTVPLIPLGDTAASSASLKARMAEVCGLDPKQILSYELCVYDTQKAAYCGTERDWFTSSRIDNLASCHAVLNALTAQLEPCGMPLALFFDHEEVGSVSAGGAAGNFAAAILSRVCAAANLGPQAPYAISARSVMLSVDMAHAYHPGYSSSYDTDHPVHLNGGPVIKYNASQRYSTEAQTAAYFQHCCEAESVPYQVLVNRADVPCGSTVGPTLAAYLGVRSADVGNPMWAMHSIRETAGSQDHDRMMRALGRFLALKE